MRIYIKAENLLPIWVLLPTALICSRPAARIAAKYSDVPADKMYAILRELRRSKRTLRGLPLVDVNTEDAKVKIWI